MSPLVVRDATVVDAGRCAEIYAPYVTDGPTSFEVEAPGPDEMARRIAAALDTHAWLVAEREGRLVGYAYATAYKPRAAYRWTCEVSVYADPAVRRAGVGRTLYEALLDRLGERGLRTAIATMTLPNAASAGLHAALGFREVGRLTGVGWKNGRWHDVALWQRPLGVDPDAGGDPAEPV